MFTAARPPVVRLAAYGPNVKWADFGLDKPPYTVTVTLGLATGKPVTHAIKLGKAEPSGERYVRVDDGPAVGVLPARAAEALARGKLDFVDRTLLAFDPAQLTALARTKGKDELEIAQTGLNWEVVKPVEAEGRPADDRGAGRPDVPAAGGEGRGRRPGRPGQAVRPGEARRRRSCSSVGTEKSESHVLRLGNPVDAAKPDGDRYARVEKKDGPVVVGVLAGALAKRLLAEPLKFRDRSLAKFVDADRLTLERGDRKVTFAKVDGTWKVTEPVQADAEQADLDELVNALANLRADELAAEKPTDLKPFGLDSPEAKWKVFAGDKEVLSLARRGEGEGRPARLREARRRATRSALLDPKLTDQVLGEYRKRAVFPDLDASQVESRRRQLGQRELRPAQGRRRLEGPGEAGRPDRRREGDGDRSPRWPG